MKLLPHLPAYEMQDVRPVSIVAAGIGLFLAVAASLALVAVVLVWLRPTERAATSTETEQLRAGPRLQVDPKRDARRLTQEALGRLQGYGWTDRKAAEAHIPIERAVEILAKQGWPDSDTKGAEP